MLTELHNNGIIYNNIAPENISLHENANNKGFFFTNFDNAIKKKIIIDSKKTFSMNRFGSKNSHFGVFPSFRDDIESLVYLLVYFFESGDFLNSGSFEELKIDKLNFVIESFYPKIPEELIIIYNYVTKVGFDETPSMSFINNMFLKYFLRKDLDPSLMSYDWSCKFDQIEKEEREETQRQKQREHEKTEESNGKEEDESRSGNTHTDNKNGNETSRNHVYALKDTLFSRN